MYKLLQKATLTCILTSRADTVPPASFGTCLSRFFKKYNHLPQNILINLEQKINQEGKKEDTLSRLICIFYNLAYLTLYLLAERHKRNYKNYIDFIRKKNHTSSNKCFLMALKSSASRLRLKMEKGHYSQLLRHYIPKWMF